MSAKIITIAVAVAVAAAAIIGANLVTKQINKKHLAEKGAVESVKKTTTQVEEKSAAESSKPKPSVKKQPSKLEHESGTGEMKPIVETQNKSFDSVRNKPEIKKEEEIKNPAPEKSVLETKPDTTLNETIVNPGELRWVKLFGGDKADRAFDIAADANGNIYIAGDTENNLNGQENAGGRDAVLIKIDNRGNHIWTRQIGSKFDDGFNGVAVDSEGNVYAAGFASGPINGVEFSGYTDLFIAKYDPDGNLLWVKLQGHNREDKLLDVAVNQSGVYAVGYGEGNFGGDFSLGGRDGVITKYTKEGKLVWTRFVGSGANDELQTVQLDSASNIYAAGFIGEDAIATRNLSKGSNDGILVKYTPEGTAAWIKYFGTTDLDEASALAIGDQRIYIGGLTSGSLKEQNRGDFDFFVSSFTTLGNLWWERQSGSSKKDKVTAMIYQDKTVYTAGYIGNPLLGLPYQGSDDVFIIGYDTAGNIVWHKTLGTASADRAYGLVYNNGGLFVGGWTSGNLDGETNNGDVDIFIAKYDEPSLVKASAYRTTITPRKMNVGLASLFNLLRVFIPF